MIRVHRSSRLSGVTLSVLLIGSAGLLAPAAVPVPPAGALQAGTAVHPATAVQPETAVQSETAAPGGADTRLPAAAKRTPESLTAALEALAAASPRPDRAMISQAFTEAGFAADSVEVSLDITPTGLAVDSIRGAAQEDGSCLFGEVREGAVSVSVLPVLDSGYCFVGDQR